MNEAQRLWDECAGILRAQVSEPVWLTSFEAARGVALTGDVLTLAVPSFLAKERIEGRYLALVRDALAEIGSPQVELALEVSPSEPEPAWTVSPPSASASAPSAPLGDLPTHDINPRYAFDTFVIGPSNRFAHAAALAVAELPGQAYNPLFIHGRPGLGKTHLLHAIGNYVGRFGAGLTVRYATVEQFTTEFVRSIQTRDTGAFKERFRGVDVLLLDDVQFLADKARTEEELFHTFNALRDSGRQLVMTSDRTPDELDGLEQRLAERFASGLVVGLDPPDLHVRRAILEKRARLDDVDAGPDLVEEIAGRVTTSVRALEAALIQVVAYASMRGEPPTPELARKLLYRIGAPAGAGPCTVADVVSATASRYGVDEADLLARDRRPPVAKARKVAMYLARELTEESLPEIGRGFGGRDHSTVLSAVRSIGVELAADPELALAVDSLKHSLQNGR